MSDEKKPPESEPERESQGSEVAHLLKMIDLEYQAAQLGLYGVAHGISNHEFINQRVENMERFRERVENIVGPDEATRLVIEQLDKSDRQETEKPKGETDSDKP